MSDEEVRELTPRERERYARHLVLPAIGEAGQRKLKASRALIVGLGGLGSPIALYLAAAGVGTLGLVDADAVGFSNLQRQVIHAESELGQPKVASAARRIHDLNADVRVETFAERFDARNGTRIAADYDLIVDGTDNFDTRYVLNDVCLELRIPYIYGAVFQLEGQAGVLCAPGGPCYRCLFPVQPPVDALLSAEKAGILGAVPGTVGTIQATEAIKWLTGLGRPLVGRFLVYDAREMHFEAVPVEKNPDCPACGERRGRNVR